MTDSDAPFHAHIYYALEQGDAARQLRDRFIGGSPPVLYVGGMVDRAIGPHPIPQFEVHFREDMLSAVLTAIEASGLRALVHPLTEDDVADHTTLAYWIGDPVELDITVLDPPGINQGIERFGKTDF